MATEDIPYSVSDHATPEKETEQDPDQPNKSVIHDVKEYIVEAIAEHKSIDVIDMNKPGDLSVEQQMAVHKIVVTHLRNLEKTVDDKLKELK